MFSMIDIIIQHSHEASWLSTQSPAHSVPPKAWEGKNTQIWFNNIDKELQL